MSNPFEVPETLYFVEWSETQKLVHVDKVSVSLKSNYEAFLEGRPSQYVPLFIATSRESAAEMAALVQKKRDQRDRTDAET